MLTLTLHCIGPLVAAGAFDKSMDDESRNHLLSLDNVYKAETKESCCLYLQSMLTTWSNMTQLLGMEISIIGSAMFHRWPIKL